MIEVTERFADKSVALTSILVGFPVLVERRQTQYCADPINPNPGVIKSPFDHFPTALF